MSAVIGIISGCDSSADEDGRLLGKWLLTFRTTTVPSSSRSSTHDPAELQELLPCDILSPQKMNLIPTGSVTHFLMIATLEFVWKIKEILLVQFLNLMWWANHSSSNVLGITTALRQSSKWNTLFRVSHNNQTGQGIWNWWHTASTVFNRNAKYAELGKQNLARWLQQHNHNLWGSSRKI